MLQDSPAALETEASAALAEAPVDIAVPSPEATGAIAGADPRGSGPTEEEVLAGYTLICGELVDVGANALVPAWRITPVESGKMAGAVARALMLWFPDMIIPPKYLALLTIAGVAFEIAQARRDPKTGGYLPTKIANVAAATAPAPAG